MWNGNVSTQQRFWLSGISKWCTPCRKPCQSTCIFPGNWQVAIICQTWVQSLNFKLLVHSHKLADVCLTAGIHTHLLLSAFATLFKTSIVPLWLQSKHYTLCDFYYIMITIYDSRWPSAHSHLTHNIHLGVPLKQTLHNLLEAFLRSKHQWCLVLLLKHNKKRHPTFDVRHSGTCVCPALSAS